MVNNPTYDVVICEDSAYDTFARYDSIFGSHNILICCADAREFDKIHQGLMDRGHDLEPGRLEIRLGVPNANTLRQAHAKIVFTDGLGGNCKSVLEATADAFNGKGNACLWSTSTSLINWARGQGYAIITNPAQLADIIKSHNGSTVSPSSTTQP